MLNTFWFILLLLWLIELEHVSITETGAGFVHKSKLAHFLFFVIGNFVVLVCFSVQTCCNCTMSVELRRVSAADRILQEKGPQAWPTCHFLPIKWWYSCRFIWARAHVIFNHCNFFFHTYMPVSFDPLLTCFLTFSFSYLLQ